MPVINPEGYERPVRPDLQMPHAEPPVDPQIAHSYSFTSLYAHEFQVDTATTGFALLAPQPTGSHWMPVERTATTRRRVIGKPRLFRPSQTCPGAALVVGI
jgi:hypothetical protein